MSILAISLFFHVLATLVWVGGLLFMAVFVYPETQRVLAENPALHRLLGRLRKRFTPLTNLALVVLIATGLTQMALDENYDGVMQITNDWSRIILIKHLVLVVMVAVGVWLQFGVTPALERTGLLLEKGKGDPAQTAATMETLRRRERRLMWLSLLLGIVIVALSVWAGTL